MGALALAAALGGCASPKPPPPPTQIDGRIEAAADLNPSVSKRPSPLVVRIYELKSAAAFNAADFVSMYQNDQAQLGAELVAREELMLQPGQRLPYAKTLAPETRYLGVIAAYRDLERARWSAIAPVQPNKKQHVAIVLSDLAVSATVTP